MDNQQLIAENRTYSGTAGVSANNRQEGFKPAFCNSKTGQVVLSQFEDGQPAPIHLISWLPQSWAASCYPDGSIQCLVPDIVCGFVRDGEFYDREQTARLSNQELLN